MGLILPPSAGRKELLILFSISINGRNVDLNNLGSELEAEVRRAAFMKVSAELRDRVGAIRLPETGEFPTVVVIGDSIEDLAIRVEGSPALIDLVKSRMSDEDLQYLRFPGAGSQMSPKAFLSFGWEDKELAQKLAEGLQSNGIETWWAEWEIAAGDSLRRRIDQGLGDCTHFVVLLTPTSIAKPWVNEEIDAGFVRKIGEKCRFIPLRHQLTPSDLPPLLSCMYSPEIDAECSQLVALINDIHGVSRKPSLGPAPAAAMAPSTGYSPAASAIAKAFVTASKHGEFADPQLNVESLCEVTGLTGDDVTDALFELRHFIKESFGLLLVQPSLFAEFDEFWMPWKPAVDALKLAADLVNDPAMPCSPKEIADRYGWEPRRLNSAIGYLQERDLLDVLEAMGSSPFVTHRISKTDATRRFVKSRS